MPNAPVGKKRPTGRPPAARAPQRPNAARARAEAERKRRSRVLYATVASVAVVVLIVVLIVVKVAGGGSHSTKVASGTGEGPPTPASVTAQLAAVPVSQLAQASAGAKGLTPINGARLGGNGKPPEVLYIGAGYCPYCAAERWPLVTALLKFGTFTGLSDTHSSPDDVNPSTPTFSFHGARYSSPYLTFTGIEETATDPNTRLDTPTAAEQALLEQYTQGTIPFVYFDGRYLLTGAQYDGSMLLGRTNQQIAAEVAKPSSPIGSAVQAAAGTIVKALCQLTGGQPGNVCAAFSGSGK